VRSDELRLLRYSADDALASRRRIALISGEPGIGKTRLAEETADCAAARGFRVIWGRCWDSGGEPPFWPWIQLVREGLRISSVAIPERLRRLRLHGT
jgi:predicted ATPase